MRKDLKTLQPAYGFDDVSIAPGEITINPELVDISVDFENVKISNVKAEDALNIVKSKFSLNSVYIINTVSDVLDSDFSKGSPPKTSVGSCTSSTKRN